MNNPTEIKRQNYLSFYQDGVTDAMLGDDIDGIKKSSAYYKKGYSFGLTLYAKILKREYQVE
jgi:hypothetical protein|tara:strand:+ start:671 stop:856 length:186 start_codon:yes stop_codon:yes gene_type:complete